MNIVGKWRVAKTMYPTDEGVKHLTKDELLELNVDQEDLTMFACVIEFKAEGTVETRIQVPPEAVEETRAAGVPLDADGWAVMESSTWKEDETGFSYVLDGESVPLTETEDGLLTFAMGMMLLEKL